MIAAAQTAALPGADETAWRALRYFNLYRVVLAGLFSVLVLTGSLPPPLGSEHAGLFAVTVFAYFVCTVVAQIAVEQRSGGHLLQTYAQVLLDVLAVTLLLHSSGGVASGLGMLLVVTIVGGSILTSGQHALAFAALASIAVIAEEIYTATTVRTQLVNYTQAGLLGGAFFAASLLAYVSARRLRESEALAKQRAVAIAGLERLNEHIVQRMRSGIIALDEQRRVRLMNASAARLLGASGRVEGRTLNELLPPLADFYETWRADGKNPTQSVRSHGTDLSVAFSRLGSDKHEGTLVFVEDEAMLRQRAQQLKLASLGRLVASIAHEVRNPLGAISHAAELLDESERRDVETQRLTTIIREHSKRVNAIVENVMNLARRNVAMPEPLELEPWLETFVRELLPRYGLDAAAITMTVEPGTLAVRMDRSQLRQVLWNLCENALRYSHGRPLLELHAQVDAESGRPYLDVIDHGPGIAQELVDHIFEPFSTTESSGTGLGLYIANELCEANQAALSLVSNTPAGCRFRIHFAHPARQQFTDV
jgi:two-component system sensor histidine kinase PilS (NtrC family)